MKAPLNASTAAALLGITLPVSPNELKRAYRKRASQEHPDVSKHPKASERFQDVKEALEALENNPAALEYTEAEARTRRTEEGRELSELGQGLGPLVNGVSCDDCNGKGYRSFFSTAHRICFDCKGQGQKRRGTGWLSCRACKSTGFLASVGETARYVTCAGCKGCGEVKIFNPVLPKGLLL